MNTTNLIDFEEYKFKQKHLKLKRIEIAYQKLNNALNLKQLGKTMGYPKYADKVKVLKKVSKSKKIHELCDQLMKEVS